jgi:hypothetical protein
MISLCAKSHETGHSEIRRHTIDSLVLLYEELTKRENRIDALGQFASSVAVDSI